MTCQDCANCIDGMFCKVKTSFCISGSNYVPKLPFSNAKVGDKVYDLVYGDGVIVKINNIRPEIFLDVHFNNSCVGYFNKNGKYNKHSNRTLYPAGTEVVIREPKDEKMEYQSMGQYVELLQKIERLEARLTKLESSHNQGMTASEPPIVMNKLSDEQIARGKEAIKKMTEKPQTIKLWLNRYEDGMIYFHPTKEESLARLAPKKFKATHVAYPIEIPLEWKDEK